MTLSKALNFSFRLLLACMVTVALLVAGLVSIARIALADGEEDQGQSGAEDDNQPIHP
jgi:hypothetical protein